jgi:hypothetical protein
LIIYEPGEGFMKKIKMLSGTELDLDGDLMLIIETLYHEVVLKKEFNHTYEDIKKEIENIVEQMPDIDKKNYLIESLFLNSVIYQNEMIEAFIKKIKDKQKGAKGK